MCSQYILSNNRMEFKNSLMDQVLQQLGIDRILLCKAVWLLKLFSLIVNMSRGKFTACMWVYCDTQLFIFRFSFLHNT